MTHRSLFLCAAIVAVFASTGCASRESKIQKHLAKAEALYTAGSFNEAELEYRRVLQLDPNNKVVAKQVGLIWYYRGAPMRALPFLVQAKRSFPHDLQVLRPSVDLAYRLGKYAEARTQARELLQRVPDDETSLLILAKTSRAPADLAALEHTLQSVSRNTVAYNIANSLVLQRRENSAGARAALQRALALDPNSPAAHTAMASFLAAQNDTAGAREEFKKAAELAPAKSEERIRYAETLAQAGSRAEAIAYVKEITAKAPDYIPAWRALAELTAAEKKYDEAVGFLEEAYKWDRQNYECELTRARILMAKQDYKGAVEVLEAVAKASPGTSDDKLQLAVAYLAQQETTKAFEALRMAVTQNPDNDEAVLMLARLQLRLGDPQSAAIAMLNMLTLHPTHTTAQIIFLDAMKSLGRLNEIVPQLQAQIAKTPERAELHRILGLVHKVQQNYPEARKSFERSLQLTPDFFPVIAQLTDIDLREGKVRDAEQRVEPLLRKQPDSPVIKILAASVAGVKGDWDQAESLALGALALNASYTPAYEFFQQHLLAERNAEVAATRLKRLTEQRPDDFRMLVLAGMIHAQRGDFARAVEAYEHCRSLRPDATVVLNNLAVVYSENLGQLDKGLELARRARELDPNTAAIADTLGRILYLRKDHAAALDLLKESASKDPANPEVQYHLGLCAEALGQTELARSAFHVAVMTPRTFADKEDAKRRLDALGGPLTGVATSTP